MVLALSSNGRHEQNRKWMKGKKSECMIEVFGKFSAMKQIIIEFGLGNIPLYHEVMTIGTCQPESASKCIRLG